MTTIGTYNIDNVLKNDTYNGFKATVTVNSTPLDLTGYCLNMFLRQRSKTGSVKKNIFKL